MRSAVVCMLGYLCFAIPAVAQQQLFFSNLTEKDGLSNNHITCFFKDKTGYLWIGTESGLNRYNGNNWKIYRPSPKKENHISNGYITAIQQDASGTIWVATRKGLNRIHAGKGFTESFLPQEEDVNSIPSDYIRDIFCDTDTSVWIAADAKDFCRFDPIKNTFTVYPFKKMLMSEKEVADPGYHSVLRILPKSATELWLATSDGIFTFNKKSSRFSLVAAVNLREISFFHFDARLQKLYYTDNDDKLYCLDLSLNSTRVILLRNNTRKNSISLSSIAGNVLLVPAPEGVACINEKEEVLFFLAGTKGKENALLPGKVNTVYQDRQGITWIGTVNGASKFIKAFNSNLNISFEYPLVPPEYPAVKNFIYNDKTGDWLISSWREGNILSVNDKTGAVTTFARPAAYVKDTCYAFYSNGGDTIFLLSKGCLLLFNSHTLNWSKLLLPPSFNKEALVSMAVDKNGHYWLLTLRGKLVVYNPVTKTAAVFPENETGDFNSCIAADESNDCMWVGSRAYGLFRYSFSEKKFRLLKTNIENKTSLHSYVINDILPDRNGQVWVATFEGGLAKYNASLAPDKGFTNYTVMENLPDDNVYSLAPDGNGGLWFTTIKGIGHTTSDGSRIQLYNQQNGLPYTKFTQGIVAIPGSKVAAVSESSFIVFDPAAGHTVGNNFPVIIDDIFVNDSLQVSNDTSNASHRFSHQQNALTFHFSVLDFTSPGAATYYYMLEGLEKDWVYAGQQHSIRYSELDPGDYTFRVKVKRENGEFYTQQAFFRFHIAAPVWQQTWFKLFVLLCIGGWVYWMIKRRIKTIRREAAWKQKITETEMMALRAQMNPHFIFNCLNAIDSFIQTNQKEQATSYLSRFARLIRNVLESSRNNVVPFEKDMESLQLYLEMEQFRCSNKFSYEVNTDPALMNGGYSVPPLIIQPFVENAIHHGLLNKESGHRHLLVKAVLHNETIQFTIADNGIGRAKARQLKELNKPGQQSDGIKITEERISLYNRRPVSGDLIITDLFDDNVPKGTQVDLFLKIDADK